MNLEEDEKIELGGKSYVLRFSVKSIFNVEKELGESLLVTLGKLSGGEAPPLAVVYTMLKWAILGGGQSVSDEEMDALITAVMDEGKFTPVCVKLLTAVAKSGVLGSPKKVMAAMPKRRKA